MRTGTAKGYGSKPTAHEIVPNNAGINDFLNDDLIKFETISLI